MGIELGTFGGVIASGSSTPAPSASNGDPFLRNSGNITYWYNGTAWEALSTDTYIGSVTLLAHNLGSTVNRFGGYGINNELTGTSWFGLSIGATSPSGLQFSTGDFTIEGHARTDSASGMCLVDSRNSGGDSTNQVLIHTDSSGFIRFYTNGGYRITSAAVISTTTWFHWALCKTSGVTKLFVNGAQAGSNYTDSNTYSCTKFNINTDFSGTNTAGGMGCELRVTKGVARYTTTFTAPSKPFSNY